MDNNEKDVRIAGLTTVVDLLFERQKYHRARETAEKLPEIQRKEKLEEMTGKLLELGLLYDAFHAVQALNRGLSPAEYEKVREACVKNGFIAPAEHLASMMQRPLSMEELEKILIAQCVAKVEQFHIDNTFKLMDDLRAHP